ncbi:RNA chaperone ProQ [Colwellia sp. M166]|uniref:RNA chaperone ProQ n=1 Tax=Colwellia sp. M166 TaxID=2583805 RepID=UPI00211EE6FD|nr:RNA chaperone ProQ [Colwellia sp. M166]UUO22344.1 RNA chaperone ProQ [Colwellia sp. M166]|tara:strand:- start:47415 stop:48155 length:741 start_codon:yes stop_codon:yes gene_type:complete
MENKTESEVKVVAETTTETTVATTSNVEAEVKRVSTKEIIAYLAEKFPACFSIEGHAKPLKIGIFQDLAEKLAGDETVSKTRLRQALRHYTSSWRYLKAIKVGSFRIDIDGNDSAEIDQEQADYANKTLKESQEKFGNKNVKDKAAKKPYKGNANKPAKPANKDVADNTRKEKFNSVKSSKRAPAKVAVKLKPVETSNVVVGKNIKVQLGQSSMDAVITEVSGKDVSVQLNSGMVVKTQVKNIFTE